MLAADDGGLTFHLPVWWAFIVALGTLATALTALTVFSRKVLAPGAKSAIAIAEAMRVMYDIAKRFGDDGHETISAELRALVVNDEESARNQQEMLERLRQLSHDNKVLDAKLSETRHSVIGQFADLKMGGETTLTVVEALERTSTMLLDVKNDLRTLKDEISSDRHPEDP